MTQIHAQKKNIKIFCIDYRKINIAQPVYLISVISCTIFVFQQCVSIVHVTKRTYLEKLVVLAGHQPYIAKAAAFIIFCADLAQRGESSRTAVPDLDIL